MDVSGALPEVICLEFKDEEWIQNINYEQIPFRCRRFHEHGHLFREIPLNKKKEMENSKPQQDEDGFVKPKPRSRANKRQRKSRAGTNTEVWLSPEGRDKTNQGAEAKKDMATAQEI
jgi:hypothetical protein